MQIVRAMKTTRIMNKVIDPERSQELNDEVTMWIDDIARHLESGDTIWTITLDRSEGDRMFWTPDESDSTQSFMM